MATGIFIAAPLQEIPGGGRATQPLTIMLFCVGIILAAALVRSFLRRGIGAYTGSIPASFGTGTWIAGTTIVARCLVLGWPSVMWIPKLVCFAGFAIWIGFIPLAVRNLFILLRGTVRPDGSVLLTTVATQAVALIGLRLFGGSPVVRTAAIALTGFGVAAYAVGAFVVLRRYLVGADWSLASDWSNTNCILHGALSITGLTVVVSGAFSATSILTLWTCILIIFAMVEAIEIARLWTRARQLGLYAAAGVYDVSQWARNFTFGMLYAFTLAFARRFKIADVHPLLALIRSDILAWGQYLVLLLLVIELVLAAKDALGRQV